MWFPRFAAIIVFALAYAGANIFNIFPSLAHVEEKSFTMAMLVTWVFFCIGLAASAFFALLVSFGVQKCEDGSYEPKLNWYGTAVSYMTGNTRSLCGAGFLCTCWLIVGAFLAFVVTAIAITAWNASLYEWLMTIGTIATVVALMAAAIYGVVLLGKAEEEGRKTPRRVASAMGIALVGVGAYVFIFEVEYNWHAITFTIGIIAFIIALFAGVVGVKKVLDRVPGYRKYICPTNADAPRY